MEGMSTGPVPLRRVPETLPAVVQAFTGVPAGVLGLIIEYCRQAVYIVGGGQASDISPDGLEALRDVLAWTPGGDIEQLEPLPQATMFSAAALANGILFVMGGIPQMASGDSVPSTVDTAFAFPLAGSFAHCGWTALPRMNAFRDEAHAAVLAGRLYVFGGDVHGQIGAEYLTPDGWVEDEEFGSKIPALCACAVDHKRDRVFAVTWSLQETMMWDAVKRVWDVSLPSPGALAPRLPPQNGSGLVFMDDALYWVGKDVLLRLDLSSYRRGQELKWERTEQHDWIEAAAFAPLWSRLYVFGGVVKGPGDTLLSGIRCYHPGSKAWDSVDTALPTARSSMAAVSVDEEGSLNIETMEYLQKLFASSGRR